MRITGVDLVPVRIPLERTYVLSRGGIPSFRNVLVRLHGEGGLVGLGECDVLSAVGDVEDALRRLRALGRHLLGMDSLDLEAIVARFDPAGLPDLGVLAAVDIACWDLNGRQLGAPVFKLMGGEVRRLMPVDFTLGQDEPEAMARRAVAMMEAGGFGGFCVKVGGHGPPAGDVARVRAVRDAVGESVTIRVDANGAFDVATAIEFLSAVEPYRVEFIEQPLPAGDLEGLKQVAAAVSIPISVDEGLRQLSDAQRLAETGVVGVFNLKISKCGGLLLAKKIAAVAASAGIPWICGGGLAFEVVRAASRHFVASTPLVGREYRHEGPGPASQGLVADVTTRVVTYADVRAGGGCVAVSEGPGLGLEEDAAAVARFMEDEIRLR